jgi:hypothetical protein
MGRPSEYTTDKAQQICAMMLERKADGNVMSLRDICALPGMPSESSVYKWRSTVPEFAEMYARAREEQTHLTAEDVIKIADTEEDPNRARVRIDARKWYASKLNRKDYGDSLDLGGSVVMKLNDEQLDTRIADILRKAAAAGTAGGERAPEEAA